MKQFKIEGKAVFTPDRSNGFAKRLSARADRRKARSVIVQQIELDEDTGPDMCDDWVWECADAAAGHPTYDCFAHL